MSGNGDFEARGRIIVDADINSVLGGVKQLQGAFNGLKLPSNLTANMTKDFDKLKEVLIKMRDLSGKQSFSKGDVKAFDKLQSQANSLFSSIENGYNEINGKQIYLDVDATKIKEAQSEIDKLKADVQSKLSNIKLNLSTQGGGEKAFGLEGIISGMEKGVKSSKVLSSAMQEVRKSLQAGDFSGAVKIFGEIEQKAETLKGASTGLLDLFKQMGLIDFSGPASSLAKTEDGVALLRKGFDELTKKFPESSAEIQKIAKELEAATQKKSELEATAKANFAKEMAAGAQATRDYSNAADQAAQSTKKIAESSAEAANQIKQLQQSTQYFFGLRNMINLLKRGVREAVDTVRDLDKAMTETAVVTNFSVGDMWKKLPEYTANANKLGATVQDMYEATTLYYQQGLDTNQAMSVANETMKMARIGGLEAADATDKMTAALRGFNMEINEASAQRVNDVYSNLAAKTASNTEELGTAMQRTASIANSAGSSFEGTAAFLAQAIETTREPAENIGTAMKTIVARFQEMKKNPLQISEVEGEEVDYNKIDAALKTIGVDLKDTNGQFRNFDEVMLDISRNWNNLTQTQQRYVATTAAGSRQQSRFIAMVSNYDRTMQLMGYANDSAGASQEQFNKTLDSFEAKVNKLQNAWKGFLMGITDNGMIKGAIDGLTGIITVVNDLINTLSFGLGPVKTFLSLMTAFTGLKMGGRILNSVIGGLGGLVDPTSTFMGGFKNGAINRNGGNPTLASQIYTPIVAAIHGLKATEDGKNPYITNESLRYDLFKKAHGGINDVRKNGGIVNDVVNRLNGLDAKSQKTLVNGFRNTFMTAEKAILSSYTKYNTRTHEAVGVNSPFRKSLINQDNKEIEAGLKAAHAIMRQDLDAGRILPQKYFENLNNPQVIQQALDAANKNSGGRYNAAVAFMDNLNKTISDKVESRTAAAIAHPNFKKLTEEQQVAAINKLKSNTTQEHIRAAVTKEMLGSGQEEVKVSKLGKALDGIGNFGSVATSAGYGLQSFGSILQRSAIPGVSTFGSILTDFGSMVSTAGMAISGLSGAATAVIGAIGAIPAAIALALGVVVAGAYIYKKVQEKQIRDKAEKITSNYKEKSDKATSNINNLQQWKEELPRLSKGVDSNGNNINLENSDYQHYLEIVDEIAKLNPEIVKGYNAQGHAIIDNNTALEETLKLQKELQENALKEYTSNDSLKALVAARDLEKTTAYDANYNWRRVGTSKALKEQRQSIEVFKPQATMAEKGRSMAQILMQAGIESKQFKDLGINLESLEAGEQTAVSALERHFDKFITRSKSLMEDAAVEVSDSTKKTFDKATEGFQKAAGEMDELVTPVYEALSARLSQEKVFQNIPDEIRTYFNQGLKDIASDANLSSNQMISASRRLSNEFANLTEDGSKYSKIMDEVAEAQDKFGEDLDAKAYKETADEAIESLERIKKGIDSTTGYGQALTEFLDNQIAKIANFTQEGEANIAEALNTMTDEIAAAEGALESFKKVEEGSNFGTAAENMKQIYDAVTTGEDGKVNKHQAGKNGDQTYWKAAETLFGREELKKASKQNVDNMLKNIEPLLQEGEAGWKAFTERWKKAYDAGKFGTQGNEKIEGLNLYKSGWFSNINTDVNPDAYKQIADALDMSEDMLVSMLNKGRQFADINFTNFKELRKGFATSDSVIQGIGGGKKKNLYIKEDTLNAELASGGITGVKEQEEYKSKLEKDQNIKVITQAAKIGMDEFVDMGINTQKSLIAVLGDTGQYSKEEIQEYAERYAKLNNEAFNKAQYKEDWKHYEAASDPIQGEQLSELESLDTTVMAILHSMQSPEVTNGTLADFKGKDLLKSIRGDTKKEGDTKLEAFGQGYAKGEHGESHLLSPKEYEKSKKEFKDTITENKEYIKQLKIGKNAAEAAGNTKQVKNYEQEIKDVKKANKLIQAALDSSLENIMGAESGALSGLGFRQNTNGRVLPFNATNDLNTNDVAVQDALRHVYEVAFGSKKKLTQSLLEDMQLLGIDIEQAIKDGLIVDPKDIYEKAKKESEIGQEAAEQGRIEGEKKGREKTPKTEIESEGTEGVSETQKPAPAEPRESTAPVNQYTSAELAKYTSGSFFSGISKWWKKVTSESNINTETGTQKKTESTTTTVPGVGQVDKNGKVVSKSADDAANSLDGVGKEAEAASGGLKSFAGFISSLFGGQSKEKQSSFTTIPGVGRVDRSGNVISGNEGDKGGANTGGTPQVENQTATLTVNADYAQVTEAKTEVQSTIKLAKKGATLKISSSSGLDETDKKINNMEKKAAKGTKGGDIKFSTSTDNSGADKGIKEIVNKAKKTVAKVKVTSVKADGAYAAINELKSYAKETVSFGVDVKKGNEKNFTVTVKADYLGQNNTGSVPQFPSIGSAAAGTSKPGTGRLGPRGKGGLTLTGELGYEVAWLPREHRSMILGTKGPEMVNLPGDAVVWNHEQSKQIVKKNAIPSGSAWIGAGSMGGSNGTTNSEDVLNNSIPKKSKKPKKTIKNKDKDKDKDKDKNKHKHTKKEEEKNVIKTKKLIAQWMKWSVKVGKITNWWENISRKVEASQKRTDQNQKRLQKLLTKVGTTIGDMQVVNERYRQSVVATIKTNNEIFKKYTKKLYEFNQDGVSSKKINKYNKKANEAAELNAEIKAAGKGNKVYNGKTKKGKVKTLSYKKAKSRLSKLRKQLKNSKVTEPEGVQIVSWDEEAVVKTTQRKKRKGKKDKTVVKRKKQKVKRTAAVDFSNLVRYDPETGAYVADTAAINRAASGKNGKVNKKKAEAIKKKANEYIDKATQRRNDAYEKMVSAGEALEEQAKNIYEQFYGWKNELTKIYELTRKITALEAQRSKITTAQELNQSRLESGLAKWQGTSDELIKDSLQLFKAQTALNTEAVKNGMELIDSSATKLSGLITRDAEQVQIELSNLPQQNELDEYKKAVENQKKAEKESLDANNAFLSEQAKGGKLNYEKAVEKKNKDKLKKEENEAKIKSNKQEIKNLQEELKKEKDKKKRRKIQDKIDDLKKKNQTLENKNSKIDKEISNLNKDIKRYEKLAEAAESSNNALLAADAAVASATSAINPTTLGKYLALEEEKEARKVLGDYLDFDSIKVFDDGTIDYDFDADKLEEDYKNGEINGTTYNKIKEILDEIDSTSNDLSSQIQEEISRVNNMHQELKELKEEYAEYTRELLDAYEDALQEDLDNRQKLFDSLNNNLKKLIDSVKKKLEQRRQAEDNAKTEEDIAKKQQRLAVLRADTSGGHAVEIAQLQKEISESQQSYGRTLEDQALQHLEEQGDIAEEQRNRQIEIAQAQLDWNKANGINVKHIQALLTAAEAGDVTAQNQLKEIWDHKQDFGSKLDIEKELLSGDWSKAWASISTYTGKKDWLTASINISEETIKDLNSKISAFAATCSDFVEAIRLEIAKELEGKEGTEGTDNSLITDSNELLNNYFDALKSNDTKFIQDTLAGINELIKSGDLSDNTAEQFELRASRLEKRLTELEGNKNKIEEPKTDIGQNSTITTPTIKGEGKRKASEVLEPVVETAIKGVLSGTIGLLKKFRSHASGGMNYTTGPAWLDGTRAKPEAVLNATDTKNFVALKDVLSNAMNGVSSIQTSNVESGPVTYDIDINVDHLNNDYDVDKVAKRVEKIITQDSSYRNVTLVRKFR